MPHSGMIAPSGRKPEQEASLFSVRSVVQWRLLNGSNAIQVLSRHRGEDIGYPMRVPDVCR